MNACALSSSMTWGKEPSAVETVTINGMKFPNQLLLFMFFFLTVPKGKGIWAVKLDFRVCLGPL